MDAPVNLKFLEILKKSREESDLPKLIVIGSCNLHVLYCFSKTGVESTGWITKSLLETFADISWLITASIKLHQIDN